jgi:phytoene dehydrogenase-like protein
MIVIVGAGLAGLSCALRLQEAGADYLLLEASGGPGGRVTTEITADGFRLDRGFQVLLDSYPTARNLLDFDALDPCRFDSGALLAEGSHLTRIRNPLMHPSALHSALLSPFSMAEKAAMVPLLLSSLVAPTSGSKDVSVSREIDRRGLGGSLRERFLSPFFSGVFLEPELGTDISVFRRDLGYFATGRALLPSRGMVAIPEQLVSRLSPERIRFGTRVRSLEGGGGTVRNVLLETGERLSCDRLVLATDEISSRRLLGLPEGRSWKSVTTLYFTGSQPLYDDALIVLPRRPAGSLSPLLHFADLTNIAPAYAPVGARLLSASLLGTQGDEAVRAARAAISAIFPDFGRWSFLKEVLIPLALPEQAPGYALRMPDRRPAKDLWLAGDQVSRASIEDVLAGGLRTADEILQTL